MIFQEAHSSDESFTNASFGFCDFSHLSHKQELRCKGYPLGQQHTTLLYAHIKETYMHVPKPQEQNVVAVSIVYHTASKSYAAFRTTNKGKQKMKIK